MTFNNAFQQEGPERAARRYCDVCQKRLREGRKHHCTGKIELWGETKKSEPKAAPSKKKSDRRKKATTIITSVERPATRVTPKPIERLRNKRPIGCLIMPVRYPLPIRYPITTYAGQKISGFNDDGQPTDRDLSCRVDANNQSGNYIDNDAPDILP